MRSAATTSGSAQCPEKQYAGTVITDLEEIRRLAKRKQADNTKFRRYLESHHHRPEPFRILTAEIERQMDCTSCANCCRQTIVNVSPQEIAAIATYLQMTPEQVVQLYTIPDADEPELRVIVNEPDGCVFLDGNLCTVYDARPSACRRFPSVSLREQSLGSRMASVCARAWFCPILYNAIEQYKNVVGYRPRVKAEPS